MIIDFLIIISGAKSNFSLNISIFNELILIENVHEFIKPRKKYFYKI